ncbi:unnamed protein product [Darwinula stevensoni]|uniref:S-adenosylmethionine sensor upstream of mTORC1 n=1 Tax=Darwinula stevensoni TaxID=69355 RepID=A0A7R8X8X3_9CRUS|nr:unnamed protein product [Darwinula stevensoni]CAG0883876.1 unnamed protein product [Darwinula stevensoni]
MTSTENPGSNSDAQTLADFLKRTHRDLRNRCRLEDPEVAWEEHRKNEEILKKYAESMEQLATKHWDEKFQEDPEQSRLRWCKETTLDFFYQGGICKAKEIDDKKCQKHGLKPGAENFYRFPDVKVRLLDVGSCFNPFSEVEQFQTWAIDIAPAKESVYMCDFLRVDLSAESVPDISGREIKAFPRAFFHVVVFSLFLEYLPVPLMRYTSCQKAFDLLQTNGLLIIVTPDSKRRGRNDQMVKSWKIALQRMGFLRYSLQRRRHIHCMAFRKLPVPQVAWLEADRDWKQYHKEPLTPEVLPSLLFIPQDSNAELNESSHEVSKGDLHFGPDDLRDNFKELPFFSD